MGPIICVEGGMDKELEMVELLKNVLIYEDIAMYSSAWTHER
jgi:hypothetical protein